MMFPLMTYPDGTEIVYSNIRRDSKGNDFVRVYAEKWNDEKRRFDSISIIFPDGNAEIDGFPKQQADLIVSGIKSKSDIIWELAEDAYAKLRTDS
ncbi:MAG: hypothetical protein IKN12_11390 [Selenomonadaceae bacterium]|nr:hypothetical protein [Selenomonadaceae bacterium]MBR3723345.1 hypothetical protein [Selenomonadaceae bacterium]